MDLALKDQVVVISGGGSGIGLAIAREFAHEQARVVLLDRSPEVESVASTLGEETGLGLITDVTDEASVIAAADRVWQHFGRVDHVVCAAGIGSGQFGFPFWNVAPSAWQKVWNVNVMGTVHIAHHFRHALIANGDSSLLFLSSVAGQMGSQTDPPYSAAKAAVLNFTQCAAKDFAPYGVRVNCLCPGMVQTPLNRAVWESWLRQQPSEKQLSYEEWTAAKIQQVVPLNRWQTPADMAAMAVFLASHRGRNITGQTLNVDGGFVMHW